MARPKKIGFVFEGHNRKEMRCLEAMFNMCEDTLHGGLMLARVELLSVEPSRIEKDGLFLGSETWRTRPATREDIAKACKRDIAVTNRLLYKLMQKGYVAPLSIKTAMEDGTFTIADGYGIRPFLRRTWDEVINGKPELD